MSNWKTTIRKLLAGTSLLMMPLSTVSAYDSCCSYDPCCAPSFDCSGCGMGNFAVGVDFLYWKPLVDDLDYGYTTNFDGNSPNFVGSSSGLVQYQSVCTKWEPGVRVNLSAPCVLCNWDASASFTWMKSRSNDCASANSCGYEGCVVNTLLHPVLNSFVDELAQGRAQKITADWHSTYYNIDALLSYKINMNPCLDITPYFGIDALYLKQQQEGTASIATYGYDSCPLARMCWDVNYWGVGLKMGSSVEQRCCDCLSVFANANATLLAGKISKAQNQQSFAKLLQNAPIARACGDNCGNDCGNDCGSDCCYSDYNTLTFKDSGCGSFVPGYHLQAGFKYASNLCGCNYAVRVGYEFLYWLNLPNPRRFATQLNELEENICSIGYSSGTNERTFGFHGLFLGAEFKF
jgi:hypothetical protein